MFVVIKKFFHFNPANVQKKISIGKLISGFILLSLVSFCASATPTDQSILDASKIFRFNENYSVFVDHSAPDKLAPGDGNTGATIGEQRLLAFKYALGIIATELRIDQPIDISFDDTKIDGCFIFAVASYNWSYLNGTNQIPNTFYPSSLANQLNRADTSGQGSDIWVRFNKSFIEKKCDTTFSYGFKRTEGANRSDFIDLILHEITHGLGFEKRPSSNGNPFIFERFLWVKDQQAYYSNLPEKNRADAQEIFANIVFNGRFTRQQASNLLDTSIVLTANTNQKTNFPKIGNDVVNTIAMPSYALVGEINVVDFNSCEISGELKDKIVLLPDGCARKELGYSGTQYDGIIKAQNQGALAVITSGSEVDRLSSYVEITLPVLTMPLSDYQNLESSVALLPINTKYTLKRQKSRLAGTDKYGRPLMHTGPKLASTAVLLHWAPTVRPMPIDNHTVRNLMESIVSYTGSEYASRTLGASIPTLIDLGWAAHSCGNGIVEKFEECDSGNTNGSASCAQNCTLPGHCGDGIVNPATEQCDNGSKNNDNISNACSSFCMVNP